MSTEGKMLSSRIDIACSGTMLSCPDGEKCSKANEEYKAEMRREDSLRFELDSSTDS
jgi:hypothetical protein